MIDGQRVAVSLTPVPLDSDSRAFRFAQMLAEDGYRSIVIEGRPSGRRFWNASIEVRSVRRTRVGEIRPGSILRSGRLRNAVRVMRQGRMGAAGEAMLYLGYRAHDWWRYCRQPLSVIPPAELYVLHSFEFYRAIAPLARRLGARILYDAHDFYRGIESVEQKTAFDRNRLDPFLRRLEEKLILQADAVTTVSGGIAELISLTFGRRPDVVRNCHDERLDSANVRPLRTTLGLGESDRLAVVVGNYKAGLAIHTAAAALQQLPQHVHLAFLGRGYEEVATKLPSDLVGRRLHLGLVAAPNEIVPLIRTADVGLVLYEPRSENYRFALPNGFFQLVAAGLPIVRGELQEVEAAIGDCAIGYCLPKLEPAAIARAISRTIAERDALRTNVAALACGLRWECEVTKLRPLIGLVSASAASARLNLQ